MNERIKRRWVEALRSGRFRKRRGGLADHMGRHCAMGVLAEVLIEDGEIPGFERDGNGYRYVGVFGRMTTGLDAPVLEIVGLTEKQQSEVIGWNDLTDNSLAEIADRVEAQL